MTCYHPLQAFKTPDGVVFDELARHDVIRAIELPCGQCIGCRMRKASDWALRIMHEASMHQSTCFVTLTYGRDCLPADGSLEHRDFQLFMKRLRKHVSRAAVQRNFDDPTSCRSVCAESHTRVRFFMCGEYGPLNLRPHFHACLFGVDFRSDRSLSGKSAAGAVFFDSPLLSRLWSHGRVSVQDLTPETASYCARYIMKKVLGPDASCAYVNDDGVIRRREYAAMSLKPGIGASWFSKFGRDVYPHDFVVGAAGRKCPPPKYYDKLVRRGDLVDVDSLEFERELRARRALADNTPERRQVREVVHNARVSTLKRGL
ncbi:MAG: replication initiator protein [Microvirus sp.]|nr:MAG: replication initiator protein [Microvirus sp.]